MFNDGVPESQYMESQSQAQQTQSTQTASQPNHAMDCHLWGFLQPCNIAVARIDFWKIQPTYTIGRSKTENDLTFPGFKVSNKHCTIVWDGKEDRSSAVTITDHSSNGTFINGSKIGKGHTSLLREGNELAFGTCMPQHHNGGVEDYRFVYRHLAAGAPTEGLHAFYDISSELGKGSFATVMKAVSRSTGKWYAVKMIHDNKVLKNDGNRSSALAREISIMEKLRHPNICQMKEVFVQDGTISLVLELVEGGDLLDYIINRGGLQENESRYITYQICEALAYVHSKGIAHRDLKPENVLLTKDVPPIVKVADFGLAKVVDSLTMLKTMCGTPSYLAPEVVTQAKHEGYQHVVDSWSVGVIVFSMLTNTNPFIEDDNQPELKIRIANRQIDWTTLENTNVSIEGQSFIRRLLEVQPNMRMTLSAARSHPWLLGCQPLYTEVQRRAMTRSPSPETESVNASMVSAIDHEYECRPVPEEGDTTSVSRVMQQMQLDQDIYGAPGNEDTRMAEESNSTTPQPSGGSGGSRTAPLQRRSLVLSQLAEGAAGVVPEPSWEMVQNASSYATAEAGLSGNNNNATTKGNKRVHSALTPLPEEMDENVNAINPLGPVNGATPARKKGKGSAEADELPSVGASTPSRGGTRVRGKNGTTSAPPSTRSQRARVGTSQRGDAISEDDVPKPRRSGRQTPQKAARRG